jgi:Anti-sigma-K factor rskA
MERTHEELKGLIAPYVLGAVDDEEAGLIRSHVLSCDECMAEAENLSAAASALALSVDPVSLPDGFEEGVVARIRTEEAPAAPAPRRFWPRFAPALGAAAMLIAIAVLVVSLINTRSELAFERDAIAALVDSEQGMALTGEEGVARMVPADGGSVFAATGLDEPPEGHIYQVWLMDEACAQGAPDCTPISAGTFDPEDGLGLLEVDRSLEGFVASAVTIEKGDGSEEGPTTDPILSSL